MAQALLYVYPTFTAADDALAAGDLPDGARVEVEHDEMYDDRRSRYTVTGTPRVLADREPLPSLDPQGRIEERLSPDAAGVIDSADYATFADAIDAANAAAAAAPAIQGLRLRSGIHVAEEPLALTEGVELLFDPGAVVDLTYHLAGLTLRAPVRASRRQIFRYFTSLSGSDGGETLLPGPKVVFEGLARGPVPVEWFGVLPQNAEADNDLAMLSVLQATAVDLDGRTVWLPVSFGIGEFEFNARIDFGPRAVRGEGHLVVNRSKRGGGYNRRFGGTILRFRSLLSGTAVTFGDADVDPSPFRVSGFAVIGPKPADATSTSTGVGLSNCIEASFVDVCVASFAVGIDACAVQGCSFDRLDVWGCQTGLRVQPCYPADSTVSNANTVTGFNINSCDVAVRTSDVTSQGDLVPDPPLAQRTSQWRFFGGTIQGGADGTMYDGAVWLGPTAKGFLFAGVWFEVSSRAAGIKLIGGEQHTFQACRFGSGTKEIQVSGGGVGLHAFRDCYAVVNAVTFPNGLPVTVAGTAQPATFDNCGSFGVLDASGLARVVGGYNPKTAAGEVDRAPARLGLDQDAGLIPWAAPASAPLQFTSLDDAPTGEQTLMRASKRGPNDTQVSLWSLRTSGTDRRKVTLHRADSPVPAFEFDLVTDWPLDPAAPAGSSDPVVIANLRERQAQLEAIIRGLVKRITTTGTS